MGPDLSGRFQQSRAQRKRTAPERSSSNGQDHFLARLQTGGGGSCGLQFLHPKCKRRGVSPDPGRAATIGSGAPRSGCRVPGLTILLRLRTVQRTQRARSRCLQFANDMRVEHRRLDAGVCSSLHIITTIHTNHIRSSRFAQPRWTFPSVTAGLQFGISLFQHHGSWLNCCGSAPGSETLPLLWGLPTA